MGTLLRRLDSVSKPVDGFFEGSRMREPGFINGVEKKPSFILGVKPLLKRFSIPNFKRLFEIVNNVFDSDEECEPAIGLNEFRTGKHLECLACTGFRQNNRPISFVNSRPGQEVPIAEKREDLLVVRVVFRLWNRRNRRTSGTGLSRYISDSQ